MLTVVLVMSACEAPDSGDAFEAPSTSGASTGEATSGVTGGSAATGAPDGAGTTGSDGQSEGTGTGTATGTATATGTGGDVAPDLCGDGVATGDEPCDGADFGEIDAELHCLLNGFSMGLAACTEACTLDLTPCEAILDEGPCGNGVLNLYEDCDESVGGETCESLGFETGTLNCDPYCNFDTSLCQRCGDGIVNGTEYCDCLGDPCTDLELGRTTCSDRTGPNGSNYSGGVLGCAPTCDAFDESGCVP